MIEAIAVPEGMQFVVRTTGEFYVWQVLTDDQEEVHRLLLGPKASTIRYMRVESATYDRVLEVDLLEGKMQWVVTAAPRQSEGGGQPVELSVTQAELSMQEQIALAVAREMRRQTEEDNYGTIEEEDDFDMEEEDPVGNSGYEVHDMPEEFPPPPPPVDKRAPPTGAQAEGTSQGGSDGKERAQGASDGQEGRVARPESGPTPPVPDSQLRRPPGAA